MGGRSMTKTNSAENATSKDEDLANGVSLDPKVLDTIGRALKAHYDDLVHAPLPDKFLDLLAQLENEEQREERQGKPNAAD